MVRPWEKNRQQVQDPANRPVILIKLLNLHVIFLIKEFRESRPEVWGVLQAKLRYRILEIDFHRNTY